MPGAIIDTRPLKKGDWASPTANDVRGPCPLLNSLANHGHIPRDGRQIHLDELKAALRTHVGLSAPLAALLSHPVFLERQVSKPSGGLLSKIWAIVRNPWVLMKRAALREVGQVDRRGVPCIDLDQLARPGVVEHDVSLTRRDFNEGDNVSLQPDLVEAMLASSSDGGKTISLDDLLVYRQQRLADQKERNESVKFGERQARVAYGELAFAVGLFGDGERVSVDRVRAVFGEERLPVKEGWRTQGGGWLSGFGIVRLMRGIEDVKRRVKAMA
ncbi:peroxidase, family 2 domain-containing protein [Sarocladium implicatum]|nr:peroxidase, family 2 domain-containing protein [Sarocladium implicatum]